MEDRLLTGRPTFEKLSELHMCLVKKTALRTARPLLEGWMEELSGELDDWLNKILMHVLERRAQRLAAAGRVVT